MRTLVVFVDALGPAQVELFGDRLGFLPSRRSLTGTMGYTCGALPSLLTGRSPVHHQRMCLFAHRDPSTDAPLAPLAWLGLLPRHVHERGVLRRRVGQLFARARRMEGYFELYRVPPSAFRWLDAPEKEDLFAADEIGGCPTFLAQARRAGLSVYAAPWQLAEDHRWQHAYDHLRQRAPDLAFLYTPVLDGHLHREGTDSRAARGAAATVAERIERAVRVLEQASGDRVRVLVVGDHGMADVRRVVDPRPVLARTRVTRHFVDSTMIRLWGPADSLRHAHRLLADSTMGGEWIAGDDRERRGIPSRHDANGHALWLLPEGRLFAPSFLGGAVRGMHGYDLSAPSSRSALLASEELPEALRATTDVASWVLGGLGLVSLERSSPQRNVA